MSTTYWTMIADRIHAAGWSWGVVGYWAADGRRMHAIDASRDGKRVIVNADDILAGFLEVEAQCAAVQAQA